MSLKRVNGMLAAIFVGSAAITGFPDDAQARDKVTMDQYCAAQSSGNPAVVHQTMDPYRNRQVNVKLVSDYGSLSMPFDCAALIPYCKTRQFVFTQGAISIVHAGLGGYNDDDPGSVTETMERLAGSFELVQPDDADTQQGIIHLRKFHGMPILRLSDEGSLEREPNGDVIVKACAAELNRD